MKTKEVDIILWAVLTTLLIILGILFLFHVEVEKSIDKTCYTTTSLGDRPVDCEISKNIDKIEYQENINFVMKENGIELTVAIFSIISIFIMFVLIIRSFSRGGDSI